MRVLLRPEVFDEHYHLELLVLLWLGATGRHRVLPDPLDHPTCERWVDALDADTRKAWRTMVDDTLVREQFEPAVEEVALTNGREAAWQKVPPTLPIGDALDVLLQPYRVILENNVNDRAFVLALCGREARRAVAQAEQRAWLVIEMGGGSAIVPRVRQVRCSPWLRLVTSVLVDSDAMRPAASGEDPDAVEGHQTRSVRKAADAQVHLHVLARRSIENYLPLATLDRWASGNPSRTRVTRALRRLSETQRHHFSMKRGFVGDQPEAHRAVRLYDGVPSKVVDALAHGFGEDIALLFGGSVRDGDEEAAGRSEVQKFVSEVLARMR